MSRPFDDTTRRNIAELCATFVRAPASDAATDLKRAAVAIALTHADEAGETALLLTRRMMSESSTTRKITASKPRLRSLSTRSNSFA